MSTTFNVQWDAEGERLYETGVDRGVLYVYDKSKSGYGDGIAWNGLTGVTESPSGAEATAIYADNIKYLNLVSAEEFGATIEAYMYPEAFAACDGSASLVEGVTIGQQARSKFGLCYRTRIGNDTNGDSHGYKIHILYNCLAAPSERGYTSVNDSPEAITFSWEVSTTAVEVAGFKPTACLTIDSTKVASAKLAEIEAALYGSGETKGKLLMPNEIADIINKTA